MISTDCLRASSNDDAFLIASSTSCRTDSRRSADLRARSVFHGFSSSRVDAMFTSIFPFLAMKVSPFTFPRSSEGSPSVHPDHLACRVAATGGQEHYRLDHFRRRAEAPLRDLRPYLLARARRLHDPRRDRVHPDL